MPAAAFELRDQLGEIVIDNSPLKLFSEGLIADLRTAAERAAVSEARAVLLRAEGDAFSAGADVSIFTGIDETEAEALISAALSPIAAIEEIPVPTLALVHGRCFAGALEVALACDLIWAATGTVVGQAAPRNPGIHVQPDSLADAHVGPSRGSARWPAARVEHHLYDAHTRGEFERAEVSVFIGKNPWMSQSFPRARVVLKEIAKDPDRSTIVIDPVLTDTAKLADYHLRVRPGTDAWCLAAMVAVLVQEDLLDREFLTARASGSEAVFGAFADIDVPRYAAWCGVDEGLLRAAARRIAGAESVSDGAAGGHAPGG